MDRLIVYPGAIPLDTDVLNVQRNIMLALHGILQATLGVAQVADGLGASPTSPAGMTFQIAPGTLTVSAAVDATPFGSLPADMAVIQKQGIINSVTTFTVAAPGSAGQSINYLVQAAVQEQDTTPIVLPFYNASNPAQAYSGPNNTGTAANTVRQQTVLLNLKAGLPATTGTQPTPAADAGYVPLYVVSVAYGQASITTANIQTHFLAPFLAYKIPQLRPGYANATPITSSGSWTVPVSVTRARVTVIGGGAGGAGCNSTYPAGGGGGGGGVAISLLTNLVPGTLYPVTIGVGGSAGGVLGGSGGTSSFSSLLSATGGSPGAASANPYGGLPGMGIGGNLFNLSGGAGADGNVSSSPVIPGGQGGANALGWPGSTTATGGAHNATNPGGGGGGAYNSSNAPGGSGGAGLVLVEY